MNKLWEEMFPGAADHVHVARVLGRLAVAMLLGGVVGFERLREHKAAGFRTHMLVALGSALFTLIPLEAGMNHQDLSRIIQGVATGIGFLGAGTILKQEEQHRIEGLTSAASIWLTAAVGMAVGAGWLWPAVLGVVLAWTVLSTLHRLERRLRGPDKPC
jgi:putative Mg2+ transporter-C (MgtC) family protein